MQISIDYFLINKFLGSHVGKIVCFKRVCVCKDRITSTFPEISRTQRQKSEMSPHSSSPQTSPTGLIDLTTRTLDKRKGSDRVTNLRSRANKSPVYQRT